MLEAKRRIGFFIGFGFIFAMIAAVIVRQRVLAVESLVGKQVPIYVASHPIPAQMPLRAEDLTTVRMPSSFVSESMITDPEDAVGMVSLVTLAEGDLVTKNMLTERVVVPKGFRVLRIYRSQRAYFDDNLLTGDRVDLVATYQDQNEKKDVTRFHLSNLLVMEADSRGAWVGIQVKEADVTSVIYMQNFAKEIQLLRLSPDRGAKK